ncbi:MAG: metallophosphoesterase [Cellulophaga sp.]
MKYLLGACIVFLGFVSCKLEQKKQAIHTDFEIGIIADCQYCQCAIKWNRFYSKSPQRLEKAVKELNTKNLKYTIHLGDFIDKGYSSFDTVVPIWNQLKSVKYHVLGNHDFEVADSLKSSVMKRLNLKNRYYSFVQNNWRFIVLDGNDLSFHGALSTLKKQQTDSLYNLLKNDSLPYLQTWNGGMSTTQLKWIKEELELATTNKEQVGFYCHFPLQPISSHNMWNSNDLLSLISEYSCVKLFFNGHNHDGEYAHKNGIHYVTFKGMVDTKDSTSFATTSFFKDSVVIKGYGREVSRVLQLD